MSTDDTTTSLRLDPKDFPKRIDLELRDDIAEKIKQIAEGSGRSFSEVATDILSKALEP
jgi:predicted transcriptional regulator